MGRLIIALCAVFLCVPWVFAETRSWTSVTGDEIQARFVELDMDRVVLETEDGTMVTIRIAMLVPADQARVRELAGSGRAAADRAVSPSLLPELRGGPGDGHYAFYSHEKFDAHVDRNGSLFVQVKDGGQPVGEPIEFFRITLGELDDSWEWRDVRYFKDYSSPSDDPESISFIMVKDTADEIHIKVEYTFDGNKLCSSAEIVQPRRLSFETQVRTRTIFPESFDIEPHMTQAERRERVKDASLEFMSPRRERTRVSFDEYSRYHAQVARAHVTGPWGGRTIHLEVDRRRGDDDFRFWNYSDSALYSGFRFYYRVNDVSRSGNYCITIE